MVFDIVFGNVFFLYLVFYLFIVFVVVFFGCIFLSCICCYIYFSFLLLSYLYLLCGCHRAPAICWVLQTRRLCVQTIDPVFVKVSTDLNQARLLSIRQIFPCLFGNQPYQLVHCSTRTKIYNRAGISKLCQPCVATLMALMALLSQL